jgi:hypothetical protein
MNQTMSNNRIKADAGKRGGAMGEDHWRRGLCETFPALTESIHTHKEIFHSGHPKDIQHH